MKILRLLHNMLTISIITCISLKAYDLSIVGFMRSSLSLGRLPISFIECLRNDLTINFIDTRPQLSKYHDIPPAVKAIIDQSNTEIPGNVALLTDHPWMPRLGDVYKKIPHSILKFAYSMVESTKVPAMWVSVLNEHFDAVVVPDEWLVKIYECCGVTIPIFVLPCIIDLDDFLRLPQKRQAHTPFTFGVAASLFPNKNLEFLVQAFLQEFGNNPKVMLHVHCIPGQKWRVQRLERMARGRNVTLHVGAYTWHEYVRFMASLDCYVLLSRGEGFSITPREALAMGIPCILSNNTAHQTLCKHPFVRAVPSPIIQPAEPHVYGEGNVGQDFHGTLAEARAALRDVYEHYHDYLLKAQEGRNWVKQYTSDALRPQLLTLVKPPKIILGPTNELHATFLQTNSLALYEKYQKIYAGEAPA